MFQPTYPIRTPRLTLRPVTLDDLDDVYAFQRRPDVVRWMRGAEPNTREQSRASVVAMSGEDALRQEGDCLTLAVVADAAVIGTVERWSGAARPTAPPNSATSSTPTVAVVAWPPRPRRRCWTGGSASSGCTASTPGVTPGMIGPPG